MTTPDRPGAPTTATAAETLGTVDAIARRIRSHRRWYVFGALVMALALAAFTVAFASWPDRLAEVLIPGILVVGAILAVLAWRGRTVPAAAASANVTIYVSAGLIIAALALIKLLLPAGFSGWAVLIALLPALPFLHLAWRVGRA
ncbi:hypothetical protein Q9R19_03305 [Microbacterium sp. ARD32]|uniref:hypothetical protein n=1 Tax=Microbacterium sp. ARD32 TaxID=2962577 RepID=UPI002881C2B6|nr:hypothetical protein [Microbacterium sp. ARD32]MDT0156647.1 hypothetical protein [Microbacterium sp. ARD32]